MGEKSSFSIVHERQNDDDAHKMSFNLETKKCKIFALPLYRFFFSNETTVIVCKTIRAHVVLNSFSFSEYIHYPEF